MNNDSLSVPNVGGIVGANSGTAKINEAYNESIVTGKHNVGGIAGWNESREIIKDVANAGSVEGTNSVGGLVGSNGIHKNQDTNKYEFVSAGVADGRNTGVITGAQYVGGLVGSNGEHSVLTNLTNDESGEVNGKNDVGGIAGVNYGKIESNFNKDDSLVNSGVITGHKNVGGIIGSNYGTITNTVNNATIKYDPLDINGEPKYELNDPTKLNPKHEAGEFFGGIAGNNGIDDNDTDKDVEGTHIGTISNSVNHGTITTGKVQYAGGIAGQNSGVIESVSNDGEVTANEATYVGGIAGLNKETGELKGNISNTGTVTGSENVGGIAGVNQSSSFNGSADKLTVLTNEGTVTGLNGSAGGIFNINEADLEYVQLVNNGQVIANGNGGTGGVIGLNKGDISNSSLINSTTGTVNGNNSANVGGVIGINEGTITGSRDENDNYYKYQIYNNGTVTGAENTGGLIGDNKGALTGGYNTGAVNGTNNVGGIAGTNTGSIDQVFNTLASSTVHGNTNVGGLVGANDGKLSNAYNTTQVSGTANVGTAVGANNANGDISFIYGIGDTLIGANGLIAANSGTVDVNNVLVVSADAAKDKNNYTDYDETMWKFYDGLANPMLKMFLTKAQTHFDENAFKDFFYNGNKQGYIIQIDANNRVNIYKTTDNGNSKTLVGYIQAVDKNGAHNIQDFLNSYDSNAGDKNLINGNLATDIGAYEMLFSQQIKTDGKDGNPNNLGYDFVSGASYNPNDPNDPYNPNHPENYPNPDPSNPPSTDIPTFEITENPSDGNDHWKWNLYNEHPWDRVWNIRERRAEFNFVVGGLNIWDDEEAVSSN